MAEMDAGAIFLWPKFRLKLHRRVLVGMFCVLYVLPIEANSQQFQVRFRAMNGDLGAFNAVKWEISSINSDKFEWIHSEPRRWSFTHDLPAGTYQVIAQMKDQEQTRQFTVDGAQDVIINF